MYYTNCSTCLSLLMTSFLCWPYKGFGSNAFVLNVLAVPALYKSLGAQLLRLRAHSCTSASSLLHLCNSCLLAPLLCCTRNCTLDCLLGISHVNLSPRSRGGGSGRRGLFLLVVFRKALKRPLAVCHQALLLARVGARLQLHGELVLLLRASGLLGGTFLLLGKLVEIPDGLVKARTHGERGGGGRCGRVLVAGRCCGQVAAAAAAAVTWSRLRRR
mmetsp:Transcript_38710/g.115027  ORF Transcript_38710/g.115027 Transcript_38710/m.115027 type:complete len:216 (-) Transcript_38710:156-803(-)